MALQKKIILAALAISAIMVTATVLATLLSTKTIPSSGSISAFNVGVYSNVGCTIPQGSITFNSINPGDNTVVTIYIKNNAPVGGQSMSLSMDVTDWNAGTVSPLNQTYNVVTFAFNPTSSTLAPQASTSATITLTALINDETQTGLTFTSINIKIIGTQV